jgi:hypothetical protein
MGSEKRKNVKLRRNLKRLPCVACGTMGTDWNPVDPAHIRTFKVTQSDHPANLISLCRECHREQHKDGWFTFLTSHPIVAQTLDRMGWEISEDPFQKGRVILTHREVR